MNRSRVKTGCITCRIRRVKCDEEKPCCKRCSTSGRVCDGYASIPFSRRELHAASLAPTWNSVLPALTMDPMFRNVFERRQFDFFRSRTIPHSNSYLACRFWERVVPQMCHNEPAIKHAVLALGSLHRLADFPEEDRFSREQQLRETQDQYSRAIVHARLLLMKADNRDLPTVLVACVIFICYENMQGRAKEAQVHLRSGLQILEERLIATPSLAHESNSDLEDTTDMLRRLDFSAMTFSDARFPYKFLPVHVYARGLGRPPRNAVGIDRLRGYLMSYIRLLFGIAFQIGLHIGEHEECEADEDSATFETLLRQQEELQHNFSEWHETFETTVLELSPSLRERYARAIALLHVYYAFAELVLIVGFYGPEKRWDSQLEKFKDIVALVSQAITLPDVSTDRSRFTSFGFDIGIILPLLVTTHKCRDPAVRRQAIQLLHSSNRQEGIYNSVGAAVIGDAIMRAEEQGLGVIRCADDVPENRRVHQNALQVNIDKGEIRLTTMTQPYGPDGQWDIQEQILKYESALGDAPVFRDNISRWSTLPSEPLCQENGHQGQDNETLDVRTIGEARTLSEDSQSPVPPP